MQLSITPQLPPAALAAPGHFQLIFPLPPFFFFLIWCAKLPTFVPSTTPVISFIRPATSFTILTHLIFDVIIVFRYEGRLSRLQLTIASLMLLFISALTRKRRPELSSSIFILGKKIIRDCRLKNILDIDDVYHFIQLLAFADEAFTIYLCWPHDYLFAVCALYDLSPLPLRISRHYKAFLL